MTYTNTPYANVSQVASELSYLGLSNIRENVSGTTQEYNALSTLMSDGIKVDLLASNTNLSGFMSFANQLAAAHPGGIIAVEGLNEVNGWTPSYNGLSGYAAAAAFQKDLYGAVTSDPALAGVAVYNTSIAGVTAESNLGNLSAYATYGNAHIYYSGGQPEWGWSTGDSTFYWSSYLAAAQVDAPGKGVVVTETGAETLIGNHSGEVGVDQSTQAKEVLNALMDSLKYGDPATYIYELMDEANSTTNPEDNFGLFTASGTAKLAATAIHNFTSILTAHGALSGTPGSLNYTISGVPQWGGQELLEQGNGAYDIVVWAEPTVWNTSTNTDVQAPNTPITINLANAANVSIYDPMTGTTATQSLGTTSTVSFNVVDHPIIVEVTPTSTSGGGSSTSPTGGGGSSTSPTGGGGSSTSPTGGTGSTGTGSTGTGSTTPVHDPVSDFNGDGKSDMLLYNPSTNQLSVQDSTGSGFTTVASTSAPAGWKAVGVGDFSGDGKADILWYNASTHQETVWNSTGGGFTGSATNSVPAGWTPVGAGDFNGDGKSDIFWYNSSTNQETVWQSTGSNFQSTSVTSVPTSLSGYKPIGIADFNGDGKADVLWYNASSNSVSVQDSNGSGFAAPTTAINAPAGWTPVGAGDINGDGKADLLWFNSSTDQVAVWNSTGSGFTSGSVTQAPAGWTPVSVGDYNGDGKSDILWYNSSTHQEAVWQSNGSGGFTGWSPGSVSSGLTPFDTFQTGTYGLHQV